jgi:PAS domain S-box-containing protein
MLVAKDTILGAKCQSSTQWALESADLLPQMVNFLHLAPPIWCHAKGPFSMGFSNFPQYQDATPVKRYGFAVLAVLVALLLRKGLEPVLGGALPFLTVWAAVVISAWYGGRGPAIVASILSVVGVWYFFLSRTMGLVMVRDRNSIITAMIGFFILSGLIIALAENTRRSIKARIEAEQTARRSTAMFEAFMDNSPATEYLKDEKGRYVYTNATNRQRFSLGDPTGKTDHELFPSELADEYRLHDEMVLSENKAHEFIERTIEADGEHKWLTVKFPVVRDDGTRYIGGKSIDISDRVKAEEASRKSQAELEDKVKERTNQLLQSVSFLRTEVEMRTQTQDQLRTLSARLLRLQDEERRRVARDLHDSTGQTLSALKMNLAALQRLFNESLGNVSQLLGDSGTLTDQAIQEIRSISYLLHPPLLDEAGFQSAAKWYVEGFGQRSGIKTTLEMNDIHLKKESELVLFRVLQESLTNVLRHSGSKTVDVNLTSDQHNAVLSIRDFGSGIAPERLSALSEAGIGVGVGLGGMKQRVSQVGGHLDVKSDNSGTIVTATLPLVASTSSDETENPESGRSVPAA